MMRETYVSENNGAVVVPKRERNTQCALRYFKERALERDEFSTGTDHAGNPNEVGRG